MAGQARIVPTMMKSSLRKTDTTSKPDNGVSYKLPPRRPPKTMTRLIAKQAWFELGNILSSNSFRNIEIDEKGIIDADSILQFALRYRTPLHILKLFALRYPRCLTHPDPTGKYATHVAAKYGSMPNVMEFLVKKNVHAAGVQDPLGKAPIHYVAEFYATNNGATVQAMYENMLEVVRILREAAPASFNLEDDDGMNAVEYAIMNDCDIKVIKTMQRTARDDWRALKANGQGKRHEELAKDIERTAQDAKMHVMLAQRRPAMPPPQRAAHHDSNQNPFKSMVAKSA